MSEDLVKVELSSYEIDLMIKYTYPFEEVEEQLKALKGKPGDHIIKIEKHDLPMLMADLVYSAKKIRSASVLEDIDCLFGTLEFAEKGNVKFPCR